METSFFNYKYLNIHMCFKFFLRKYLNIYN